MGAETAMGDERFTKAELKKRIEENELDLSLSSIVKIPVQNIMAFPKVTFLDLSNNKITYLPDSFSKLRQLSQLDLSKNFLSELPDNFGQLSNLKRLDLFSNRLTKLPLSFTELQSLKWLDLKQNPFQDLHPKVVGDCLSPKECQACAIKVLEFMIEERHEADKERQKNSQLQKVKELKERKMIEEQAELKRRQKKEEKERRRKAFLEQEKEKRIVNGDSDNHITEELLRPAGACPKTVEPKRSEASKSFTKFPLVVILSLAVLLISLITFKVITVEDFTLSTWQNGLQDILNRFGSGERKD